MTENNTEAPVEGVEVEEDLVAVLTDVVENMKAFEWLEARKHFGESEETILESTTAVLILVNYQRDKKKGWKHYENMTLGQLQENLTK